MLADIFNLKRLLWSLLNETSSQFFFSLKSYCSKGFDYGQGKNFSVFHYCDDMTNKNIAKLQLLAKNRVYKMSNDAEHSIQLDKHEYWMQFANLACKNLPTNPKHSALELCFIPNPKITTLLSILKIAKEKKLRKILIVAKHEHQKVALQKILTAEFLLGGARVFDEEKLRFHLNQFEEK